MAGLWKTRDGRVLRVEDMTTEHLTNAVKMLLRQIARHEACIAASPWGGESMAAYYATGESERAFRALVLLTGSLRELRAELRRRLLPVPGASRHNP